MMQPEPATRPKPTTRSSIRHSLNLSSVGRALADVMHKDSGDKDKDRPAKKAREAAVRRNSAIHVPTRAPVSRKEKDSPDTKTITRQTNRLSIARKPLASSEDSPGAVKASPKEPPKEISRAQTLRPRGSLANGSSLPKYRPRSMLITAPKKPPSPARAGTRRRLSTSDDDKEDVDSSEVPSPIEKQSRPISPLPHRAALKVNLTAAVNVIPATPVKVLKPKAQPSPKTPPARSVGRPMKLTKGATAAPSARATIPRPPSSSSSASSSKLQHTPKTPTRVQTVISLDSDSGKPSSGKSSLRRAPLRATPDSSQNDINSSRAPVCLSPLPTPIGASLFGEGASMFVEGNSTDSMDEHDIEFMLSSVASPTAPTPALPRFRMSSQRLPDDDDDDEPHTPSRSFLPARANLSYLSPGPSQGARLRPIQLKPGNDRGSILSWEQLAQHSRSLSEEDDIERMLSDIPAPFRPTSALSMPDSPSLSALPSPTGYGSISQVLLPDVTPSPAPLSYSLMASVNTRSHVDGEGITMLRLQLAAAENAEREARARTEALEAQLRAAAEARAQDAHELESQIAVLEEQVQGNLKGEEGRAEYMRTLEEKAAHARQEKQYEEVRAASICALAAWDVVRETAEVELELVRASKETLAVLLAGLDESRRALIPCSSE